MKASINSLRDLIIHQVNFSSQREDETKIGWSKIRRIVRMWNDHVNSMEVGKSLDDVFLVLFLEWLPQDNGVVMVTPLGTKACSTSLIGWVPALGFMLRLSYSFLFLMLMWRYHFLGQTWSIEAKWWWWASKESQMLTRWFSLSHATPNLLTLPM